MQQERIHKGVSHLSESRIEWTRYSQTKDKDVAKRIVNKDAGEETKARRQAVRKSLNVSKRVDIVNQSFKRKCNGAEITHNKLNLEYALKTPESKNK